MLLKYNPKSLADAKERYNNLYTISPDLDLGNGLTLVAYLEKIEKFSDAVDLYNRLKAEIDGLNSILPELDFEMKDWNERMLIGVAAKHGKNSEEYVKAGGTKKTARKKPKRKTVDLPKEPSE